MTATAVAVAVLLALGVGAVLLSSLGLLLMRDVFDRLHYLGPAATLGPLAVGAAVLVEHSSAQAVITVILIAGAMLLAAPVLTHATARAAHVRRQARTEEGP